jgi:hypothetical protein
MPQSSTDIKEYTKEMEDAGLFGCVGSVDATHIGILGCLYSTWNQHKGPKDNYPARTYNIIVNHR